MTTGIYPRWPFPDRIAVWDEAAIHLSESSSGVRQAYDRWSGRYRKGWRLNYIARPELSPHGAPGFAAIRTFWQQHLGPAEAFLMPSFACEARLAQAAGPAAGSLSIEPYSSTSIEELPFQPLRFTIEEGGNDRMVLNEDPALEAAYDIEIAIPAGNYSGFSTLAGVLEDRINASAVEGTYTVRAMVTDRRFEIQCTIPYAILGRERYGIGFGGPLQNSILGILGFRNTENRTGAVSYSGRRSVAPCGSVIGLFDPRPANQWNYGLGIIVSVSANELQLDPLSTLPTTFEAGCLVEPLTGAAFVRQQRVSWYQPGARFQSWCEMLIQESFVD